MGKAVSDPVDLSGQDDPESVLGGVALVGSHGLDPLRGGTTVHRPHPVTRSRSRTVHKGVQPRPNVLDKEEAVVQVPIIHAEGHRRAFAAPEGIGHHQPALGLHHRQVPVPAGVGELVEDEPELLVGVRRQELIAVALHLGHHIDAGGVGAVGRMVGERGEGIPLQGALHQEIEERRPVLHRARIEGGVGGRLRIGAFGSRLRSQVSGARFLRRQGWDEGHEEHRQPD
jgi:hypothetical protein